MPNSPVFTVQKDIKWDVSLGRYVSVFLWSNTESKIQVRKLSGVTFNGKKFTVRLVWQQGFAKPKGSQKTVTYPFSEKEAWPTIEKVKPESRYFLRIADLPFGANDKDFGGLLADIDV